VKRGLRVVCVVGVASMGLLLTAGIASAGEGTFGAEDDLYETPFNTPVVLSAPAPSDNDVPEPGADDVFTEIDSLPTNGALDRVIGDEADGVTYTPDPGFTGSDQFDYAFISFFDFGEDSFEPAAFDEGECFETGSGIVCVAIATVFIEVGAPPVTTTTTTTTVAPTTTTSTTVAVAAATVAPTTTTTVAAQAQLPVTGGNGALAVIGSAAAAAGIALVAIARRRSAA